MMPLKQGLTLLKKGGLFLSKGYVLGENVY